APLICDVLMALVVEKVLPAEKPVSAVKLPAGPPPALIETPAPGPTALNLHQLMLNRDPPPPVNTRYRSCTPVAPLTLHDTVVHVCQPPVPGTAQVPINVPVGLPSRSWMLPPLVALATRASKREAPAPKSTPTTRVQSPFSMNETLRPPSLEASVSMPCPRFMVSASTTLYGFRFLTCRTPLVVIATRWMVPSALWFSRSIARFRRKTGSAPFKRASVRL